MQRQTNGKYSSCHFSKKKYKPFLCTLITFKIAESKVMLTVRILLECLNLLYYLQIFKCISVSVILVMFQSLIIDLS